MFGRQFLRQCKVLPRVRQMSSNQIKRRPNNGSNTAVAKKSQTKKCNLLQPSDSSVRGFKTIAVDTNVNFMKQMEKFSILRCSAVGISAICQPMICLSNGEGLLDSSEDDEEACPVKRQWLMMKAFQYVWTSGRDAPV